MKIIICISLICVISLSCKSQKETFQPIADNIKWYFLNNVPEIKKVDTIFVIIDTLTPSKAIMTQSAEYLWAWTEAKKNGNKDSSYFKNKSDSLVDLAKELDNSKFLFFRARSMVIYETKDSIKTIGEKWLYFNEHFYLTPKYSFIKKVAQTDNEKLVIRKYQPVSSEDYKNYQNDGIFIYY